MQAVYVIHTENCETVHISLPTVFFKILWKNLKVAKGIFLYLCYCCYLVAKSCPTLATLWTI